MRPDRAVSIVIPTRDRPIELARAVSASLCQRHVELDVIIVDDGSVPRVALLQDIKGVQVVRLESPAGVAAARNRGIAEATHSWIAFLDDDDLWSPDRLSRMLASAAATNAEWVVSGTVKLDNRGRPLLVRSVPDPDTVVNELRSTNLLGGPSAVMVHRSLLDRVGGFDESFSVLADWELWIRLAAQARLAVCPEVLNGYVVHASSMHIRRPDEAMVEFDELRRRYGTATSPTDPGMYDEAFLRWSGSAYLNGGHHLRAFSLYWQNWRRYGRAVDVKLALFALLGGRLSIPRRRQVPPPPPWIALYQDEPDGLLRPVREEVKAPSPITMPPAEGSTHGSSPTVA